ncbi:MAG: hypothetical protein M3R00_01070 [Pseudomonadota bacterium]|nr:hypothetical protein [Pseudomonadota bacterium]
MAKSESQPVNVFTASIVEFVSRSLIDKAFFQNANISQTSLLYLANELIRMVRDDKKKKMNVTQELIITYKQLTGRVLTEEELEYQESDREIDVMGEVLNGVFYSSLGLLGKSFCSSIFNAAKQSLWEHMPALVGCVGAVLYGPHALHSTIETVLSYSQFTTSQKELIRPWLNSVGRLALGFIPKVHATEAGVHYHYPSLSGHTATYTNKQFASRVGDDITYKRIGTLFTPEGEYAAEYHTQFKLHQVDRLTEQSIRIQVINQLGENIPVEFKLVLGEYGPEIQVISSDSLLASRWENLFIKISQQKIDNHILTVAEKEYVSPLLNTITDIGSQYVSYLGKMIIATNMFQGDKKSLMMGLMLLNTVSSVGALSNNKNSKTQCLMNMCAELLRRDDYLRANSLCREALNAGMDTAELRYTLGQIAKKLGQNSQAVIQFNASLALNHSYDHAAIALDETQKIFTDYHNKTHNLTYLPYSLSSRKEIFSLCESIQVNRDLFFEEHDLYVTQPLEYLQMCLVAHSLDRFKNDEHPIFEKLKVNYMFLEDKGWVKKDVLTRPTEEDSQSAYAGMVFIKNATKKIVIVHRSAVSLLLTYWYDKRLFTDKIFNSDLNVARKFVNSIVSKYHGYSIVHTGYHIGAAIAEAVACEFGGIAITANSPGYLRSQEKVITCDAQIVTYVTNQNFINTMSTHIGSIRHVDSPISEFFDLYSIVCLKFHRYTMPQELRDVIYGVIIQRLQEIISRMDICTGYPAETYHVQRWKSNPIEKAKSITTYDVSSFYITPLEKAKLIEQNIDADALSSDFQRTWVNDRMGLEHFSMRARDFLRDYLRNGLYPSNLNPSILKFYYLSSDDELVLISDSSNQLMIYSVIDFQDYIEMKLYEAKVNGVELIEDKNYRRDTSDMVQFCDRL